MGLKIMNNEEGSIVGVIQFILSLVFGFSAYMFMTLPVGQACLNAVQSYWTVSGLSPDAAYTNGLATIVGVNSSYVIGMLVFLMSAFAFLVHDLRSRFQVS